MNQELPCRAEFPLLFPSILDDLPHKGKNHVVIGHSGSIHIRKDMVVMVMAAVLEVGTAHPVVVGEIV